MTTPSGNTLLAFTLFVCTVIGVLIAASESATSVQVLAADQKFHLSSLFAAVIISIAVRAERDAVLVIGMIFVRYGLIATVAMVATFVATGQLAG